MEKIISCRDCENLEDRRDIDRVALCALRHGPSICCEEFEPRDKNKNANNLYNRFCVECANFEDVNGIPVCAKLHAASMACDGAQSKLEKVRWIRQSNLAKTVLLEYIDTHSNLEPIPVFLMKIAEKLKW